MKFDGGWCYANSLLAAAQEAARKIRQNENTDITEICRDYGIFLDQMNDSEIREFMRMVESYVN